MQISVSSSKNKYKVAASLCSRLVILNTRSFVTQRMIRPTWYFTQPTHAQHCMRKWCQKVSADVRWSRDGIANGKRRANLSLLAPQCVSSWRFALVRKCSFCYVSCQNFMLQHFFLVFFLYFCFCCSSYYATYFSDFPSSSVFSHFSSFLASVFFFLLPFTV